jgi:hypothetical protein
MKKVFLILLTNSIMTMFLISTASAANLDLKRLLLFYPCDEGGGEVLKDASGRGFDAALPKAKWEAGVFDKAIRLQKTNSEVKGDIISSVGKTGEISMMCWVNMTVHTTYNGLISIEAPEAGCCEFRLMIDPTKNPFWDAGRHADKKLGNFAFELKKWYHYAMAANGEVTKIYVDGKFIGEQVESFKLPTFKEVTIYVGTGEAPGTWTVEDLAMDEIMIWDKALDEKEMKMVMEGSKVFMAVNTSGKLATTWAGLKK